MLTKELIKNPANQIKECCLANQLQMFIMENFFNTLPVTLGVTIKWFQLLASV